MVSIVAFQAVDPGSIPGRRTFFASSFDHSITFSQSCRVEIPLFVLFPFFSSYFSISFSLPFVSVNLDFFVSSCLPNVLPAMFLNFVFGFDFFFLVRVGKGKGELSVILCVQIIHIMHLKYTQYCPVMTS